MTTYGKDTWWICPNCDCQQTSNSLLYSEKFEEYYCMFCGTEFNTNLWKRAD